MTHSLRNRAGRFFCISATTALILCSTACGTIMHPERKGQTSGQIDAGVAVLNGVGLLFFLIPGVIAYAVDFSNGTIYLPNGTAGAEQERGIDGMIPVVVGTDELTPEKIRSVLQSQVDVPIPHDAPVFASSVGVGEEYHTQLPR